MVDYVVRANDLTKKYVMRVSKQEAAKVSWLRKFLLGKTFKGRVEIGERVVVDHVSIQVREGEVFGILGPNGAGKTTLLEILSTAVLPDEGSAMILGYDLVKEASMVRKVINPCFSFTGPNLSWTARQNLEYIALMYNLDVDKAEVKRRVDEVVELVGLRERIDEVVKRYSSGMLARLNLAMSLLVDRPIYLMDEPFLGIDPATARELRFFIRNKLLNQGRTFIIATNLVSDAEELCDRVALMKDGKVICIDTPANLKRVLKGKDSINVEAINFPDKFINEIRRIKGVVNLAYKPVRGLEDAVDIRVQAYDSRDVLLELIDIIYKGGGKVRYVKVSEPSLEDVFIHYTGGGFND